jgi:acetyl-CoA C-acetyltransferase
MSRICIVNAKRTPQGRFLGALAGRSAVDLATAAARAALDDHGGELVDQVIVGNILGAGQGMNVARQVGIDVGVPQDRPAFTVNMMCASGLQAVILAAQAIKAGEARVVLCGGTESMSNAPYLLDRARGGYQLGDGVLIDSLLRDGLIDTFSGEHMALTTEKLAERYELSRRAQDEFALRSQRNYAAAAEAGRFAAELAALPELASDEHPRPDTTLEKLHSLKAAFKKDGTITAGNASGINDGAAMLVVCDEEAAEAHGWEPLAVLRAWATVGCDPQLMGLGPVYATRKLCKATALTVNDFDTVEINEAFAAQTLACIQEIELDPGRVNPDGGAIALGHPLGASGARLVVHLAQRIAGGLTERGLVTLCVGGGMGVAAVLERP